MRRIRSPYLEQEGNLEIRRGEYSDIESINDLILSAKKFWGYSDELIQLWLPAMRVSEPELASREFWVGQTSGKLVAAYSCAQLSDEQWELDDFWIHPQNMGQGVGRVLFQHAIEQLQAKGAKTLKIESDPNAQGFYEKMGARCVGKVESIPAGRFLPVLAAEISWRHAVIPGTEAFAPIPRGLTFNKPVDTVER